MFDHDCGEPQLPLPLSPASLTFCLQRIPFLIKGRRSRKEDVTICRTTTCQCAQSIRNFRECSKAVQVSVRGCLLFVSQGVLDGKEAFALLGQNGSSQMPDGMKTERFYPGLGASLFITWAAKTPFTSTIKGVRRIYQKPSWTPTLSGSLTSCTRPRRPTPVLTF